MDTTSVKGSVQMMKKAFYLCAVQIIKGRRVMELKTFMRVESEGLSICLSLFLSLSFSLSLSLYLSLPLTLYFSLAFLTIGTDSTIRVCSRCRKPGNFMCFVRSVWAFSIKEAIACYRSRLIEQSGLSL